MDRQRDDAFFGGMVSLSFPSLILAMIINAVMGSNLFNTMFALVIVRMADLRAPDAKRRAQRQGK
ncbi:MAG: hypothetical protein V8S27_01605 [Lachnospiraceae bacterium]